MKRRERVRAIDVHRFLLSAICPGAIMRDRIWYRLFVEASCSNADFFAIRCRRREGLVAGAKRTERADRH